MKITKTLTAMAVALAATTGTSAVALDELVVGYFMEWPTANQYEIGRASCRERV